MLDRVRDWRLPVRYKVPPRNDLIAFALMALAFGLMVGLAIAPGWGNADSTGPVVALPAPESPDAGPGDAGDTSTVADLRPPVGGAEGRPAGDDPGAPAEPTFTGTPTDAPVDSPTDTADEPAGQPDPSDSYSGSPDGGGDGDEEGQPPLKATVVGSDETGYAVADSAGNLLYVHYAHPASARPKVGKRIGIGIDPLDNGTFLQSGALRGLGTTTTSKLTGVVSWIDPDSGVIAVSSRGVSVAVAAATAMNKSASPPVLGSLVTGTIEFKPAGSSSTWAQAAVDQPAPGSAGDPGAEDPADSEPLNVPSITAKRIDATGPPLTQVELAGPVTWDADAGSLAIAADSFGTLNREITLTLPKKLGVKNIEDGLIYAASADLGSSGGLTLAGLSANYSLEAAADPNQAFGTHSR